MGNNQIKELVDEIIEGMFILKSNDTMALKKLSEISDTLKTNSSTFSKILSDKLTEDSIELGYCFRCYEMLGLDCTCDKC